VVLFAFNVVVITGVGFLVFILRHFVREARPRHAQLGGKSRGIAQPLEVLGPSGHTRRALVKASGSHRGAVFIKQPPVRRHS
jgi:hypothetical protein